LIKKKATARPEGGEKGGKKPFLNAGIYLAQSARKEGVPLRKLFVSQQPQREGSLTKEGSKGQEEARKHATKNREN